MMRALAAAAALVGSLPPTAVASCPRTAKGDLICAWRGECSPDDRCLCEPGFRGADCSERVCPVGRPFTGLFGMEEIECSGRGICDRDSGRCVCHPSFFGHNCERLRCGGGNAAQSLSSDMSMLNFLSTYVCSYTQIRAKSVASTAHASPWIRSSPFSGATRPLPLHYFFSCRL